MKPRRRRGRAADGTGATRAAGTRLNWSPLQRVDEVGVHRVRRLHRAVDLSLGFPEITGGLDVVVDLSGGALRAHDRLARLQIEQRERAGPPSRRPRSRWWPSPRWPDPPWCSFGT